MPEVGPKPIQQIYFTGNLDRAAIMFFITEEQKKLIWIFHKQLRENCKCTSLVYNISIK